MKTTHKYVLYISILWLLVIFIVNPIGDFPLNDDWSYALNAKALAVDNTISFDGWGAMTLIVHSLWGAAFCKIFGFSFTVLRISTLVLGFGALWSNFLFFRESGLKAKTAFWGTLLLMFNPFFLLNSFTYMTEIPFLFFFMTAAFFFQKSINGKGKSNIIYATIFAILATLIRQIGILIPIAFAIPYILKNKTSLKLVIQGVMPFLLSILSLNLFVNWRETNYGLSANFGQAGQMYDNLINGKFLYALEHKSYGYFILWGLFLIPILILLTSYFWKKTTWKEKLISTGATLLLCYPFIIMPNKSFIGNTLVNFGFGPYFLATNSKLSPPQIGTNDWDNILMIGFVAAIFLVQWIFIKTYHLFLFIRNKKEKELNWSTFFALGTAFAYFVFLMLNNHYIDRYNLIAVPFLILFLIPISTDFKFPKIIKGVSFFSFLLVAVFSIGATHDYLSWNKARWAVTDSGINDLHINPKHINGGFEYNNGVQK